MNILPLSFRDIEYIVAVADELHFGKAAHRLHVSQPTLSEQIKKVENMLGIIIFERTKRSVQVTPQGMEFITTGKLFLPKLKNFTNCLCKKKALCQDLFTSELLPP